VFTHTGVKTNDSLAGGEEESCKKKLFKEHKDFGRKYVV